MPRSTPRKATSTEVEPRPFRKISHLHPALWAEVIALDEYFLGQLTQERSAAVHADFSRKRDVLRMLAPTMRFGTKICASPAGQDVELPVVCGTLILGGRNRDAVTITARTINGYGHAEINGEKRDRKNPLHTNPWVEVASMVLSAVCEQLPDTVLNDQVGARELMPVGASQLELGQ